MYTPEGQIHSFCVYSYFMFYFSYLIYLSMVISLRLKSLTFIIVKSIFSFNEVLSLLLKHNISVLSTCSRSVIIEPFKNVLSCKSELILILVFFSAFFFSFSKFVDCIPFIFLLYLCIY